MRDHLPPAISPPAARRTLRGTLLARRCAVRGVLTPVLALCVLAGCETKTPAGPTALPTTTTTTTTIVPPTPTTTTSSSTTTTIVLGSLARRYVAFNPPANQPSEMTLFFELLTPAGGASSVSSLSGMLFGGPQTAQETENRYRVTGVYIMQNGTTGGITGTLGGASNPLETGGTFTGMFTAKTPLGCTAERPFAGRINPQTLQLGGTEPGTSTCSPSPLAIPGIEMLRSDPAAPIPTPPSTTSVSTTTTTSILCTYSVSPTALTVESTGGAQQVSVTATGGCAWSAQSFADWITVRPPFGSAGSSTVVFDVQPNASGAARSGTLLIAGTQVTVTQGTPVFADLVPEAPGPSTCRFIDDSDAPHVVDIIVRNLGTGDAPESQTRIEFLVGSAPDVLLQTPQLARNPPPQGATNQATETVDLPRDCWRDEPPSQQSENVTQACPITVTADHLRQVTEESEVNNTVTGSCTRTIFRPRILGMIRPSAGR